MLLTRTEILEHHLRMKEPTLSAFEGRLGETFRTATGDGETISLELVEAAGITSDTGRKQPFSLLFKGPKKGPIPQQTFTVEHDAVGSTVMFLVPMGPDEDGFHRYEAVFN